MHKQIELNIRGQHITVDRGVRDLIILMNRLPGVETEYSCQGDDGEVDAYVRFRGPGAFPLLSPIARAILREESIWKRRHRHVCRGCRSMTVTLQVCGDGIALRWQPWDYRRVLKIVVGLIKRETGPPATRSLQYSDTAENVFVNRRPTLRDFQG